MKRKEIYDFGPFRLDPQSRVLWRGDERLSLTPKVFDTLRYMAENPGRLLSKEEMLRAIWPDRFVEEANLAQNVSVLRRTLGEVEDGVKYIATFHGRGYQFLPPVRIVDAEPPEESNESTVTPATVPPSDSAPVHHRQRWIWLAAVVTAAAVLIAVVPFVQSRSPEPHRAAFERVPLTRLPGSESQPALTRDGTKRAFIWDQERAGLPGVFVKGIDDDEPRMIAVGVDDHGSPAWSPDGRQLAYVRPGHDALQLVVKAERGGDERVVAKLYRTRYGLNCRHLDWSPDGLHLVVDDKEQPDEPLGLFLIDLASGAKSRLTKPTTDIIGDVDPRFSPDGRTVSFIRMTDRFQHELATVPAGGGKITTLVSGRERISGHDWAKNGASLVYASSRSGGEYALWEQPVRDGTPRNLGIGSANPIQLAIARTGGQLVYSDVFEDLNIWRLDLETAAEGRPNWRRVIGSTAEDILPQLSPDGSKVCFRSDRSGQDQLWLSDSDGVHATQLTHGSLRPVAGRWSRDSRSLVFHGAESARMFIVDITGGSPRSLGTKTATGGHPIFNPDGRSVLFNDDGLRQMPLDGTASPVIIPPPLHEKKFSADGKYLYYTAGRTDTFIWRYDLSAKKTEKVVSSLLPGYWGAWALAEGGIYYLSDKDGTATIRLHEFSTNREIDVVPFLGPLPPIGTSLWSISPDQRWLYCVRVDVSASDLVELRGLL